VSLSREFRLQGEEFGVQVDLFSRELDRILAQAQRATLAEVDEKLSTDSVGVFLRTRTNVIRARRVGEIFSRNLFAFGYSDLVNKFVSGFDGQFNSFGRILNELKPTLKFSRPPVFSAKDIEILVVEKLKQAKILEVAVSEVAQDVNRKMLTDFAGSKKTALQSVLVTEFARLPSTARTIATTGISTHFRTLADAGYRQIEKDLGRRLKFTYDGPDDVLTRPWCHRMLALAASGKVWTRAQIASLVSDKDRGTSQPRNVLLTGGGWGCRHQFLPGK